jgi:multiple sugar transport system substrate-binding protein
MQRLNRAKHVCSRLGQLRALILLMAGCAGPDGATSENVADKPLQGTTLTLHCPDARLRSLYDPLVRVWTRKTGATVELRAERFDPDHADLGILPFAELGELAAAGEIAPVPLSLREPGNPYQWSSVLSVYRGEPYAGWGRQMFGLPLAADGFVLVYRTDRLVDPRIKADFRMQFHRPLTVPTAWEDFADVAAFFAERDRRPSLPRVTSDLGQPSAIESWFFRIAACYDRPLTSETLAFQFDLNTGKPRIDGPAFASAARLLASLKARGCLPTTGSSDPIAALEEDRAVLAMVPLYDLIRLKRNGVVPARYGIAPLPGTKQAADAATGKLASTPGNYMPFFDGGWLGAVSRGCKDSAAAFALLAELGGPARSQEIVAAGGFGPLRDTHLEADRTTIWLGYGFDGPRTKALQEALLSYLGKSVRNPTFGLRTPDRATLSSLLLPELNRIVNGEVKPEEALKRAAESWEGTNPKVPRERLLDWRRKAAGLN